MLKHDPQTANTWPRSQGASVRPYNPSWKNLYRIERKEHKDFSSKSSLRPETPGDSEWNAVSFEVAEFFTFLVVLSCKDQGSPQELFEVTKGVVQTPIKRQRRFRP